MQGDSLDLAHPITVDYARGFSIETHPGYRTVTIFSPETGDTTAVYILYPREAERPETAIAGARYIGVPIERLACMTSTELGALPLLNARETLVACGSAQYVCDSIIRQRIASGQVIEIARGMGRNVEALLAARPEVLLQDFSSATDKDADIVAAGVEIIQFNNWKEETLLGRAEWLKLIGILTGRARLADEVFTDITRQYDEARALIDSTATPLPIMYGQDYKGAWYVPGEHSFVTAMLRDAGMHYDYIEGQVASMLQSFETVFSKHRHARLWLCMMAGSVETVEEFVKLNDHYAHFDAVRSGEVWVDSKRLMPHGANDVWESGIYNPHLILKDLIRIAHPELLPDYETTYWRRLP